MERIKFNDFEEPQKVTGTREDLNLHEKYGGFPRTIDGCIILEHVRVHPDNPNLLRVDE